MVPSVDDQHTGNDDARRLHCSSRPVNSSAKSNTSTDPRPSRSTSKGSGDAPLSYSVPMYPSRCVVDSGHRVNSTHRWPWRLPRFLTVLYIVVGATILGVAIDAAILARSSCSFREVGSREALASGLCVWEIKIVNRMRAALILLSIVSVTLHVFYKVWHVMCYQCHKLPTWVCRIIRLEKRADAWVSAASLDLFDETVRFLQSTNLLLGGLMIPFTFTLGVALSIVSYTEYEARSSDAKLVRQCGADELCYVAKCFIPFFMAFNAMLLACASVCMHSIPAIVWSSTMELAMRKTGNLRVRRLMRLPYLCSAAYILALGLLIHEQTRLLSHQNFASAWEMKGNFILQLITSAFLLLIVWLNMLLQDIASFFWSVVNRRQSLFARTGCAATDIERRGLMPTVGQSTSEASANHRRETLLLIHLLLWSNRVLSRTPLWELIVIMLMRLIALVILATVRDRRSNFNTIEDHAGFGLVIQASELSRRLKTLVKRGVSASIWDLLVASAPSLSPSPFGVKQKLTGHDEVRMFKATLYRMRDTLAVSYRWQDVNMRVSEHISLNMNEFQIRSLITAIDRSRCQYVWLDRLSVPQDDCPLKYTLLARMMAVYAAAGATVALRTAEADGSRYHQRVWTFPEYCAATNLHVVTQDAAPRQLERAVVGDEEQKATQLRDGLQSLHVDLVPMWLRGSKYTLTAVEAADVLARYRGLAAKLRCQFPEDKIRALLPLLMHTPVESQGELIKLVLQLSKSSGEELQDWKMCLFDQQLDRQRAVQTYTANSERDAIPATPRPRPAKMLLGWLDSLARAFRDMVGLKPRRRKTVMFDVEDSGPVSRISERQKPASSRVSLSSVPESECAVLRKTASVTGLDEERNVGWDCTPVPPSPLLPWEIRVPLEPRQSCTFSRHSQEHHRGRRGSMSSFDISDTRRTSRADGYVSAVNSAQARELRRARLEQAVHVYEDSFAIAPSCTSLPGGVPEAESHALSRWSGSDFANRDVVLNLADHPIRPG